MSYSIVRMYRDKTHLNHIVRNVRTLEEAQEHCRDPETSSSTCTTPVGLELLKLRGPWFDGYQER